MRFSFLLCFVTFNDCLDKIRLLPDQPEPAIEHLFCFCMIVVACPAPDGILWVSTGVPDTIVQHLPIYFICLLGDQSKISGMHVLRFFSEVSQAPSPDCVLRIGSCVPNSI